MAIAGAFVFVNYMIYPSDAYYLSHAIVRTRATLLTIKNHLIMMHLEGCPDPIDMGMLLEYAEKAGDSSISQKVVNGYICDEWKNPIQITYNNMSYTFVSFGPNRKDDNGLEDDIVDVLNVSVQNSIGTEENLGNFESQILDGWPLQE